MANLFEPPNDVIFEFTYEEVIINLKLISEIQINDKLRIYGNNIDIDSRYIKSIMRIFYGDGRANTVKFINMLINYAIKYSNNLIQIINSENNENPELKHNKHQLNVLTTSLNTSLNGLNKIKITYQNDNVFIANIELISDKIRVIVDNNMNNTLTIINKI